MFSHDSNSPHSAWSRDSNLLETSGVDPLKLKCTVRLPTMMAGNFDHAWIINFIKAQAQIPHARRNVCSSMEIGWCDIIPRMRTIIIDVFLRRIYAC